MKFALDFLDEVRARTSLVGLIGEHIALKRAGREWKGCCPFHAERTPSFYVSEDKGFYHCFGCQAHGDAIGYRMRGWHESFADAVIQLAYRAGMTVPGTDAPRDRKPLAPVVPRVSADDIARERARDAAQSLDIWRAAKIGAGSPVETYLRSRGIFLPVPPSLRFVEALPYWIAGEDDDDKPVLIGEFPAMIGAIQDRDGDLIGLHRTYLDPESFHKLSAIAPDGSKLDAKKMRGRSFGGAVRFAKAGDTLAVAEGIETALSVAQACPGLAVWAALSLGNLCGAGKGEGRKRAPDDPKTIRAYHDGKPWPRLPPVEPDMERPGFLPPFEVKRIVLLADADNKDPPAAEALLQRAARRYRRLGLTVSIARPDDGHDFNSMLTARLRNETTQQDATV